MPRCPGIELLHCLFNQRLADVALLNIGAHAQRPKKADASPARGKVGTDQLTVERRAECRYVRCMPAAVDVVPIAPEHLRVRSTEESPKSEANYSLGFRQVFL